jgi:hypothetical protein
MVVLARALNLWFVRGRSRREYIVNRVHWYEGLEHVNDAEGQNHRSLLVIGIGPEHRRDTRNQKVTKTRTQPEVPYPTHAGM